MRCTLRRRLTCLCVPHALLQLQESLLLVLFLPQFLLLLLLQIL